MFISDAAQSNSCSLYDNVIGIPIESNYSEINEITTRYLIKVVEQFLEAFNIVAGLFCAHLLFGNLYTYVFGKSFTKFDLSKPLPLNGNVKLIFKYYKWHNESNIPKMNMKRIHV